MTHEDDWQVLTCILAIAIDEGRSSNLSPLLSTSYELVKQFLSNLLSCFDWSIDQPVGVLSEAQDSRLGEGFCKEVSKQMDLPPRASPRGMRVAGPRVFGMGT